MTIETRTLDQLPENQGDIQADSLAVGDLTVDSTTIFSGPVNLDYGMTVKSFFDLSSPDIHFEESPSTGLLSTGANVCSISANGVLNTDFRQSQTNHYQQTTFPDGSAAAPALIFGSDLDTGIYRPASNTLGISTSGALRASINSTDVTTTVPVYAPTGSAGTPSFTTVSDPTTGMYSSGASNIAWSLGGLSRMRLEEGNARLYLTGIGGVGSYNGVTTSFQGPKLVFERAFSGSAVHSICTSMKGDAVGNNFMSFLVDDSNSSDIEIMRLGSTATGQGNAYANVYGAVRTGAGAVGAPSHTFISDLDTGFYNIGANNLGIACSGALSADFNTTRLLVPLAGTQTSPSLAVGGATYGFSLADGLCTISNGAPRQLMMGPSIALTSGVSRDVVSLAWGASEGAGSMLADYQVEVSSAAGRQIEVGQLRLSYTSRSGVYQLTPTKVSSQQDLTSGTLTVTFGTTLAATSLVSVTATTSLGTPTLSWYASYRPLQQVANVPTIDVFF